MSFAAQGTPTGAVTFSFTDGDGRAPLPRCQGTGNTVTLRSGTATCTVSGLVVAQSPLGVHATYAGSSLFTASAATPMTEPVTKASTSVAVSSTRNPLPMRESLTLTATVTAAAPGAGTPTGTVTWVVTNDSSGDVACRSVMTSTSGRSLVSSCVLSANEVSASGSPYSVSATYSGDANLTGSAGTFVQKVG